MVYKKMVSPLTIQNGSCLALSLIGSFNVLFNYLYNTSLDYSVPFFILYFGVDLFYCKPELKLHHVFCLVNILYKFIYNIHYNDTIDLIKGMYLTEVSTIFLSLKYFISNTYLQPINNALFVLTFFYFRIYNYYNVISNEETFIFLKTFPNNYLVNISSYGLYVLNIYWATLILKMITKNIIDKSNSPLIRRILSYIHFGNTFIGFYMYSQYPKISYIPHMLGLLNLSIQSYNWHSKGLEYIDNFNIVSDELLPYFLKDNAAIQLCAFTTSLSGYYNSEHFYTYLISSIFYHSIPFSIQYFITMSYKKKGIIVNENSSEFLVTTYALTGIPIIFDISISVYHSLNSTGLNLFLLHAFIGFMLKINPFYQYNHIVFHLSLYLQTILMCYSNLR